MLKKINFIGKLMLVSFSNPKAQFLPYKGVLLLKPKSGKMKLK